MWLFCKVKGFVVEKDISTLKDYIKLVSVDWEGKRAIVFGEDQYRFLKFCKANLPNNASYGVVDANYGVAGAEEDPLDLLRLNYYLYPSAKNFNPDFILVYKNPGFEEKRAYLYASLNKESFILKRK